MGAEGLWACNTVEVHLLTSQRRIGLPKALLAAEVGQSGIDTHVSAGCDYQRIGLAISSAAWAIESGVQVFVQARFRMPRCKLALWYRKNGAFVVV